MSNVTAALASYIKSSTFEALPAGIRRQGARAFVNWVGCAAGGAREEVVKQALGFFSEFNGACDTTLVGRREKLDLLNATYINTLGSTALMFNDTHAATVAHPIAPVAAALLALAERRAVHGRDFILALILGIEVQCRVGNMLCVPPAECAVGLSMGGLVGGIGAAVAAARVLALDEKAIAMAIGLAANHASGLRQAHASMANSLTPAHAARCGLMAALMAARGIDCNQNMLEGKKGFGFSFGHQPNFDAAIAQLGLHFEIDSLSYKPYPSGFVSHPVIEACLEIAQQDGFDTARVERIELTVNPVAARLMDRPQPDDLAAALMSVQHWAAVALVCRAAGVAQMTAAVAGMAAVVGLRRKVTLILDARMGSDAAHVRVVFAGGEHCESRVLHCRGSAARPMSDADLTNKSRAQLLTAFAPLEAQQILDECWRIEESPAVGTLCGLLRSDGARGETQMLGEH